MSKQDPASPQEAPPMAQLLITMSANRSVQVNGPIQDDVFCYGLLEKAKDAIREWHTEQAKAAAGGLTIVRQPLNNNGGNGA